MEDFQLGKGKWYLFTAENAESAEMTKKERLNRITESIICAAIEVHLNLGMACWHSLGGE